MASAPATIALDSLAAVHRAQAILAGTAQSIVDLYERNPEQAYGRLAKAVADYEDVLFADRRDFWAGSAS
jgi:hypothetical protein